MTQLSQSSSDDFVESELVVETSKRPASWRQVLRNMDRPWAILILLFGVTAALGLPVLWASRKFSTPQKAILSVIVTLYTFLLFWIVWQILLWSYTNATQY